MIRFVSLATVLFLSLFLVFPSITSATFAADSLSPHQVYEQFIKAWMTNDPDAGSSLNGSSEEHVSQMQKLNAGRESCPNPGSMHLLNEKIDGQTAEVTFEALSQSGAKILSKARLVRTTEGWKISQITPQEPFVAAAVSGASKASSSSATQTQGTAASQPLKSARRLQFEPAKNLSDWSRQALTLAIPNAPFQGTIGKAPFKCTRAEYAIWWKTAAGPLSRKDSGQHLNFDLLELTLYREGAGLQNKPCALKVSMALDAITDKQTVYLPHKVKLAAGQFASGTFGLENCSAHETDCCGRVFLLSKTKEGKLPAYLYLRMQTNEGPAEFKGYVYATEMP